MRRGGRTRAPDRRMIDDRREGDTTWSLVVTSRPGGPADQHPRDPGEAEVRVETADATAAAGLRSRPFITLTIVLALGVAGWTPLLSFLSLFVRDQLGAGLTGAGWLLFAMHATTGTLGLASGLWIRRLGSRWTYAAGLAGMTVFAAFMAVTPSVVWFLALAPLAGLALALHWTGMQAYTLESTPSDRRGVASGIMSFVAVVAPGVAGVVQGLVAEAAGFGAMALVATGMLGLALIGNALWLPTFGPRGVSPTAVGSWRAYARLVRDRSVAALLVTRAATTVAFAAMLVLAGPKLLAAGGDLRTVGLFTLAASLGGAVAQIGIGWLSDAIGRRGVFATTLVLGGVTAVLFGLADGVGLLLALSALYFLAFWAYQTLILALAGDVARPGSQNQVVALTTSAFSWGVALGAVFTAVLVEVQPGAVFVVGAAAKLVALAALPWLRGRSGKPRAAVR